MTARERFQAGLARQLGHPRGLRGRAVAAILNRRNRSTVTAAVAALAPRDATTVADVGFGGGLGLGLLLDAVGPRGHVHGFDPSDTALEGARRRHGDAIAAGRLTVATGTMDALGLDASTLAGAISINTVYFIEDLAASAAEMARVLAPDGTLVIGIGDPARMREMSVTSHGFRIREVDEIAAALSAGGLELVRDEPAGKDERPPRLLVARPRS